ncbi:hypothetical protein PG993_008009 [Apiospora rasikravindrae]|uniref:Uncharacterized protein n=1 Tax=Apiospora rasikravindrae TaxID=990691 RepID=A0ABR1SZ42_9PEZI
MAPKKTNGSGSGNATTSGNAEPPPSPPPRRSAKFGLNQKKTVMQRFNRICAKLNWFNAEIPAGTVDPATPAKKKPGRPKKKNGVAAAAAVPSMNTNEDGDDADAEAEAEAEGSDDPSPAKKRKVDDNAVEEV